MSETQRAWPFMRYSHTIATLTRQHDTKTCLYILYNLSLSIGYFPRIFKHATKIFIPKSGKPQHQIKNYRPFSLLDKHGKLLDKILNTDYHQHGFSYNRGVKTALVVVLVTALFSTTRRTKSRNSQP